MPTSSERGPVPSDQVNPELNELKVTVMSQIDRIKHLEEVLEELRNKKRRKSVRSQSSSKGGHKSPHGGRKSSTLEAPSMMGQSRRSNHDLFNVF
jgi:hypothetical protein